MNGYEIRYLMSKRGILVKDIADHLGITSGTVSENIHSKGKSARVRQTIADALNRSVDELWPTEKKRNPFKLDTITNSNTNITVPEEGQLLQADK